MSVLWAIVKILFKIAFFPIWLFFLFLSRIGQRKHQSISNSAESVLSKGGDALDRGSSVVADLGSRGTAALFKNAMHTDSKLGAGASIVGAGILAPITVAAYAGKLLGKGTKAAAPHAAPIATSLTVSSVSMVSDTLDSIAITDSDIDKRRRKLVGFGQSIQQRADAIADTIAKTKRAGRRNELLDRLIIGGVTLAAIAKSPAAVPADVERAFQAAYPGLAAKGETFSDAVQRMSDDQLLGLVAATKGKLFELHLVDHLNSGVLPDGYTAAIAGAANQPGWDIVVTDPSGAVSEVFQAKATESAAYVREALTNYPTIDVYTTEEVFSQLSALSATQASVIDSGISEAALESAVNKAAGSGQGLDASDFLPSSIGLAVISLSVFLDSSLTPEQRAAAIGERTGRAGVSAAAGKALMLATGTWWIGLVGGVATHWLASNGRAKRAQLDQLDEMLRSLGAMERRERKLLPKLAH